MKFVNGQCYGWNYEKIIKLIVCMDTVLFQLFVYKLNVEVYLFCDKPFHLQCCCFLSIAVAIF